MNNIVSQLLIIIFIVLATILSFQVPALTNVTLIEPFNVYIIFMVLGIGLTIIAKRKIAMLHISKFTFFDIVFKYGISVLLLGGLSTFLLLYTNIHLKTKINEYCIETTIVKKGYERRRNRQEIPYVDIKLNNLKKRIYLTEETQILNINKIELIVRKGILSYYYIYKKNIK